MPELPEVEIVTRGLRPAMVGALISRVDVGERNLRFPFPEKFGSRLEGRRITGLTRRAKYILARLDDDAVLLMHLGMTGRFVIAMEPDGSSPGRLHNAETPSERHEHVVFHLTEGNGPAVFRIGYVDPRRFGFMDLIDPGGLGDHRLLASLGVEPLNGGLDVNYLRRAFAGKRAPLKAALLDQRIVAGLGNIYVCEALYRAGLSPIQAASSLAGPGRGAEKKLETLISTIIEILQEAIAAGGSTLRDFAQTDGSLGYFQHSFSVYDREGQPCQRAGCKGVIERGVQSGRSTFYCPKCQNAA